MKLEKIKDYQKIAEMRKFRNVVVQNNANLFYNFNNTLNEQTNYEFFSKHNKFDLTSAGYKFINDLDSIKEYLEISRDFINSVLNHTKSKVLTSE